MTIVPPAFSNDRMTIEIPSEWDIVRVQSPGFIACTIASLITLKIDGLCQLFGELPKR